MIMRKVSHIEITPVISFNADTETRQVKYDGIDVGTIVINKNTKERKYRTPTINIDDLYRIAEWSDENLGKFVEVKRINVKPSPLYNLFIVTKKEETDERIEMLASLIIRNKELEDLPF